MKDVIYEILLQRWQRKLQDEINQAMNYRGDYECGKVDMLEEIIAELKTAYKNHQEE